MRYPDAHPVGGDVERGPARAALAVNSAMVEQYWRIGRLILDRQLDEGWGVKVIERLAVDIKAAYPQVKGYSKTSLDYMRRFAMAWPAISQQPAGKIPWGHIMLLLDKVDGGEHRDFYTRRSRSSGG